MEEIAVPSFAPDASADDERTLESTASLDLEVEHINKPPTTRLRPHRLNTGYQNGRRNRHRRAATTRVYRRRPKRPPKVEWRTPQNQRCRRRRRSHRASARPNTHRRRAHSHQNCKRSPKPYEPFTTLHLNYIWPMALYWDHNECEIRCQNCIFIIKLATVSWHNTIIYELFTTLHLNYIWPITLGWDHDEW